MTSGKLLPSSVGAAWEDAKAALPPGLTPGPSFLQAVPGPHGWGQLHRHFGLWHSALDRGPGQHCALLGPAGGPAAAAARLYLPGVCLRPPCPIHWSSVGPFLPGSQWLVQGTKGSSHVVITNGPETNLSHLGRLPGGSGHEIESTRLWSWSHLPLLLRLDTQLLCH